MARMVKKIVTKRRIHKETLINTLIFSLDDLCNGRKIGQKERRKLLSMLVDIYSGESHEAAKQSYMQVLEFLTNEGKLIKMRRSFSHFDGPVGVIGDIMGKYPSLQGLFLSVLYLSDMQKDIDLTSNLLELGEVVERVRIVESLKRGYDKIMKKVSLLPEHINELQVLRDIANEYSLSGTFIVLPEITVGLSDKSAEYKDIVAAIKRFPVAEQLRAVRKENLTRMNALLLDIADIFIDYTIGDVRKKALIEFPGLCKKYSRK